MENSIQKQIERGILPNPYELRSSDVGKYLCPDFGVVIKTDAGRLVFVYEGILSMESNDQLRTRQAKAARKDGAPL